MRPRKIFVFARMKKAAHFHDLAFSSGAATLAGSYIAGAVQIYGRLDEPLCITEISDGAYVHSSLFSLVGRAPA